MRKTVNMTPHAIVIKTAYGGLFTVEPSGVVARVSTSQRAAGEVMGVPVRVNTTGGVVGLPAVEDMHEGDIYLVSGMVLSALGSEYVGKVFAPDTGASAIRDEAGHIVAVTALLTVDGGDL